MRVSADWEAVARVADEAGCGAAQAQALRLALGLGGGIALTAEEVYEAVLDRGTAFPLANGWRLARRRAMGAARIESCRPPKEKPPCPD